MKKIIVGLIVVALVGLGVWKLREKENTPDNTVPPKGQNNDNTPDDTPALIDNRKYKDGSYTASGSYTSPAGPENIEITVVLKDDIITSSTFVSKATHPTSKKMQGLFGAGFKSYVVGKPIDEVSLTVVNGSSITPKGFMDALSKIKLQAKA